MRKHLRLTGSVIGTVGYLFLGFSDSWLTAIGVLLCIWGNNIHFGAKDAPEQYEFPSASNIRLP